MSFYDHSRAGAAGFAFPQGAMDHRSGGMGGGVGFGNMSQGSGGPGGVAGVAPDPLPSGFFNALSTRGYAHEPPLLEEVGIHPQHIWQKTRIVMVPLGAAATTSTASEEVLTDCDLAGPLLFFLTFGLCLLLAGRVHFGYVYGVALFGTVSLHNLAKLMGSASNGNSLQLFNTASVLGYCFLPLCFLTAAGIFTSLNNTVGYTLGCLAVLWATWSASAFLNALLQLQGARLLIAYPLLIFYSVFALMAIFV
ncbi:transporter YIP1 KNAG_0E03650 [Huiozyma naganishii CBS 8797]|uniref:Protein YIP n=1 Tax=Huiozyma naganishii (strain ATCC MYA-139 / BCRC 22969 / CBS 8797 / KCTC 17520 / NBRC 10181 / NCYC 3082 / Yp74L-3) TaxID=1071383 RepID=J7RZI2_HUIN7|nr:hypothetical protein KNAG_0E03650 [Kazachstania naganishii CBS 8797]CCK70622.1 hypothetical protein KNAG_0E03650 [Kazachstania naganishii CBS 8797]